MNRHPAVWVFKGTSVGEHTVQPILWGLEEEGIPFEIRGISGGLTVDLAKQAAHGSPLDVGIAIGDGGEVVLHHRDLPAETPLFSLENSHLNPFQLRRLGMNAARLVKREPLALGNDTPAAADNRHASGNAQKLLEELIFAILDEVFTNPSFDIDDSSRSHALSSAREF